MGDVGLEDWSEIVVTFHSALVALEKACSLWHTGGVQQQNDYSVGFWSKNFQLCTK